MSDAWDFYFANLNDVIASLFVDLGIRDSVPDTDRPWLLWTWVYLRDPRDDGLSSSEEAPILNAIEDALTKQVKVTVPERPLSIAGGTSADQEPARHRSP